MMNANHSAHNQHKQGGDFFDGFLTHLDNPHTPTTPTGPVSVSELLNTNVRAGQYIASMQQQQLQNGVSMDVLEGLMGMQDNRGGQSGTLSNSGQPTPQMLVEQQMRLNQLQQLYQLQTQIFQQQVSLPISEHSSATRMAWKPKYTRSLRHRPLTIFHQIELLSGQSSFVPLPMMMDRPREQQQQQQYLPTPGALCSMLLLQFSELIVL